MEKWEHPFSGREKFQVTDQHISQYKGDDLDDESVKSAAKDYAERSYTNRLHEQLYDHYAKHFSKLGQDVHNSIAHYSLSGYNDINKTLYYGRHNVDSAIQRHISNIDKIFAPIHDDVHVYSGVAFSPHVFRAGERPQGGIIKLKMPAFTSTSIKSNLATSFASSHYPVDNDKEILDDNPYEEGTKAFPRTIIKIHVPKGARASYIYQHSENAHERELVLPRNSRLHVHPTPTVNGGGRDTFQIFHAKLVHDGLNPTRLNDIKDRTPYVVPLNRKRFPWDESS